MKAKNTRKRKRPVTGWYPKPSKPAKDTSVAVAVRAYSAQLKLRANSQDLPSSEKVNTVFNILRVKSRTPGQNVPNYRVKIKQHQSATSSFDATKFSWDCKNYYGKIKRASPSRPSETDVLVSAERTGNGDGYSVFSDCPTTPPSFSGSAFTTANNLAVQRLYDTIRQMESHVSTGETLGEYNQTINLFKRGLGGIRDLMSYVSVNHKRILEKGAQWNNMKRTAKSLADLTLEYRFGIEPLAKVLGEGAGAIQRDSYMEAILPFSVSGKANSAVQEYNESWESFPTLHLRTVNDNEFKVRFKGEYRLRSVSDGPSYARSLGLTWREFVPTIYNLIPYSFLLDYVVNLHTFVETVAVPYANVAWCVRTDRARRTNRRFYSFLNGEQNPLFYLHSQTPGYLNMTATGVRRREQSELPLPILQWKKPSKRALENTLALVAGRLPVIGNLTKRILRSPSGKSLDNEFRLATRASNLKVPYPYHSAL